VGDRPAGQRLAAVGEIRPAAPAGQRVALDPVNRAIIEQLQVDGRAPYASIGRTVGLSEAAVRQRVQRLLDDGVMQIVAVTDPLRVGFFRAAMVGITVDGDVEAVSQQLADVDELEYVVVCAGGFDILVEVVCEDDERLLEILNRRIRAIPGVHRAEAFVYLRLAKQSFAWGSR